MNKENKKLSWTQRMEKMTEVAERLRTTHPNIAAFLLDEAAAMSISAAKFAARRDGKKARN